MCNLQINGFGYGDVTTTTEWNKWQERGGEGEAVTVLSHV